MREYLDFLGRQSPYDSLGADDLELLASRIEVEFFPRGAMVVEAGADPLDRLYVIRTGAVEIVDRGRVVDMLGPGDTFGHVSLLSGLSPALSVRATEDTLCYLIPDPRPLLEHPERLRFSHYGTQIGRDRLTGRGLMEQGRRPVSDFLRPLVWCTPDEPIGEVARRIGEQGDSCAVFAGPDGLGIVTDHDFRARVATGDVGAAEPVSRIATPQAHSLGANASVSQAFLLMLERDIHHLVVVDDDGRPLGVIRALDVAAVELRDPLLIRSSVERARTTEDLVRAAAHLPATAVEMFDAGVPALHLAALLSTVRDAILRRLVALLAGAEEVGVESSWMVLGSTARGEPLPASDLDTAIVWIDVPDRVGTGERVRAAAGRLLDVMEACGLDRCVDGANATNPLFSQPLSQWQQWARDWVREPTGSSRALLASILADSRPVTGIEIGRSVTDVMLAESRSREFLDGLLEVSTAQRPPTGFVRDFVVEHSGEHRGQLDLKRGGMRPIVSLARWAAVVSGDVRGSTAERVRRGAEEGIFTQDEADSLLGAYQSIFGLLLQREVEAIRRAERPSTYLDPRELDSLTRRYLREAFRSIAEIQARLQGEWVARAT